MPAERTTDTSRHSPGEVRSLSPAIFVGRDRLIVSICIVLTVGLAWMYLVRLAHQMAPAMAYGTAMAAMNDDGCTVERSACHIAGRQAARLSQILDLCAPTTVLIERPPSYARNSAAWSVAHWRNVRGGTPVSSANVDVTNAG